MRLRVKEANGRLHAIEADPQIHFDRFREMVHKVVPGIAPDMQKLIFDGRLLDADTLKATGLKDGDILVVLAARSRPRGASVEQPDGLPSAKAILAATQRKAGKPSAANGHLKKKKKAKNAKRATKQRNSIRQLDGADGGGEEGAAANAAVGEAGGPVSPAVGTDESPAGRQQRRRRLPKVPQLALRGLVEMGFTPGRARKALLLNGMNTQAAMEWLLMHGEDEDIDAPITEEQQQHIIENERNFEPDAEAARQLGEMGFGAEDVTRALRYARNNQDAALAWLLSDRQEERSGGEEDVDDEEDMGEVEEEEGEDDHTSEVLQAILGNPSVRAGLQSERVVQALERVMQNPHTAMEYLNDPEIGPIILQIHSIISNPEGLLGEGDEELEDLDEEGGMAGDDDLGPMY